MNFNSNYIKPPRFLGGFFIVIALLVFSSFVSASSSTKVTVWVNTSHKSSCEVMLQENNAQIKYYSSWLSSFYISVDVSQLATIKSSSYVNYIQRSASYKIPEPIDGDENLEKRMVDLDNMWFENFSDRYNRRYV